VLQLNVRKKSARLRPVSVGTNVVCKSRYTLFGQWGREDLRKTVPGSFFYYIFFFFLFHLFVFFSNIFISRPRHFTAYTLPIPHYTTIVYRVHRSPAAAATQRQFAEFDQFLTLYRSAIGAIPLLLPPSPRVYEHAPSSAASKSTLGPYDAAKF